MGNSYRFASLFWRSSPVDCGKGSMAPGRYGVGAPFAARTLTRDEWPRGGEQLSRQSQMDSAEARCAVDVVKTPVGSSAKCEFKACQHTFIATA